MLVEKLTIQDEQRLVERARAGDGEAFGQIYDAFKGVLFASVIYPMVRDSEAAGEVLQETFLLALRKIGSFNWQDRSIFFWLRMIAINKAREWNHSNRRKATVDESVLTFLPDNTYQPDDMLMLGERRAELQGRIGEILATLNERYRKAIELRLMRKQSRAECAAALGTSIETFDVVFFRACRAFRDTYNKSFGPPR